MAKGYSARRGFSNGSGQMLKQQQMQQQIMKMQEDMQKAQQEVEEKTFSASVGGGVVSAEVNGKKEVTGAAAVTVQVIHHTAAVADIFKFATMVFFIFIKNKIRIFTNCRQEFCSCRFLKEYF